MNTQVFTHAKNYTKLVLVTGFSVLLLLPITVKAEWTVDFSRRAKATRDTDLQNVSTDGERGPASVGMQDNAGGSVENVTAASAAHTIQPPAKGLLSNLFESSDPVQEIVILNTEKGFVPSTVRVRKDGHYKIHVVNVNEKEKNISFILDGFSEHDATYYGKIKSFEIQPKKEGVYSFQSPETASEGKLIVFNPQVTIRAPASEDGK